MFIDLLTLLPFAGAWSIHLTTHVHYQPGTHYPGEWALAARGTKGQASNAWWVASWLVARAAVILLVCEACRVAALAHKAPSQAEPARKLAPRMEQGKRLPPS